jgi:3-hydroxyisobutyrate dehydrogenase-like beta-hydroxyacid dehydrogenase
MTSTPEMNFAPPSNQPIGVIGLGLLGSALAERLLEAGFALRVHNRTREKAAPLEERGAVWSDNPLRDCQQVVICLYTTEIVEATLEQLGGLKAGQVLVDTTTGDPSQTEALGRRLAAEGIHYLETPIAASSDQTRRGEALAMVAGQREAFEAARGVLQAIAPRSFYVGPWGNAGRMKLVNNLIIGLNRVALAEGLAFAQSIGIQKADALAVLREGNAHSVAMDVKGRKMVEEDFSTQAKLSQHLKDVRLILQQAAQNDCPLPFSELHCRILEQLEEAGHGELDNSAIIKAYDQRR